MCGPGFPEIYLTCMNCGHEDAYDMGNANTIMVLPESIVKESAPGDGRDDVWLTLINGKELLISPTGSYSTKPMHAFYDGPNAMWDPFDNRGYWSICKFECYNCGHDELRDTEVLSEKVYHIERGGVK